MSSHYKMVVFDMAGTTVDEQNLVYKILHQTLVDDGYDCSLEMVLAIGAGKEKKMALKDILIELGVFAPQLTAASLHSLFKVKLKDAYNHAPILPMPGTEMVFAYLKQMGIKVILNTGYDRSTAEQLIQRLGWLVGEQIDGLITASDVSISRPAPNMIDFAMQQFGIEESVTVVKVGDSIIDIEEGKNAGCGLTIGITTGAHDVNMLQLAEPNHIIHQLSDLILLLHS